MLLLTSTSDLITVITASSGDIRVHASYVDNASGTITPGRTNTASISTNTTTTVVGSPGSSVQRNVRSLSIYNNHASVSNVVTVNHTDGTTVEPLITANLLPGERLALDEEGEWHHRDSNGADYGYTTPVPVNLGPTNTIAETIPRELCMEVNGTCPTASGTLFLQAIKLYAGQVVNAISISSATTAIGTPTHYWFALYHGSTRALLAQSADQTSTAWAANTLKTLNMVTPYRVPTTGIYYIGLCEVATTISTSKCNTAKTASQLAGQTPIISGTSSTGITTALPDPAGAITAGTVTLYAAVS